MHRATTVHLHQRFTSRGRSRLRCWEFDTVRPRPQLPRGAHPQAYRPPSARLPARRTSHPGGVRPVITPLPLEGSSHDRYSRRFRVSLNSLRPRRCSAMRHSPPAAVDGHGRRFHRLAKTRSWPAVLAGSTIFRRRWTSFPPLKQTPPYLASTVVASGERMQHGSSPRRLLRHRL